MLKPNILGFDMSEEEIISAEALEKENQKAIQDRAELEKKGKEAREIAEAYNKATMGWINASLQGNHNETMRLFKEKERLLQKANEAANSFFEAYKKCFPDYERFLH